MGKGKEIGMVYRDEDVVHRVEEFLSRQHFPSFQRFDVEMLDGSLTVRGSVDSFYEKQIAMSVCQNVPGVLAFVDDISVDDIGVSEKLAST
jgi:osmotically-inducible protein OsmY